MTTIAGFSMYHAILWENRGKPYCRLVPMVNESSPHFGVLKINGGRIIHDQDGRVGAGHGLCPFMEPNIVQRHNLMAPRRHIFDQPNKGRAGKQQVLVNARAMQWLGLLLHQMNPASLQQADLASIHGARAIQRWPKAENLGPFVDPTLSIRGKNINAKAVRSDKRTINLKYLHILPLRVLRLLLPHAQNGKRNSSMRQFVPQNGGF